MINKQTFYILTKMDPYDSQYTERVQPFIEQDAFFPDVPS
jgi:hypothetical protein